MKKGLTHYQGALIGAAIGDALGFITEKKPITEVNQFVETYRKDKTYSIKSRTYPDIYSFGQNSDDTQFSKLLLESLLENKCFNAEEYLQDLVSEFKEDKLVGLGRSTRKILAAASKGEDLSNLVENSSNGSLMRSFVVGLYYSNEHQIADTSFNQSELTHCTSEAMASCAVMALSMNFLKTQSKDYLIALWSLNNPVFGYDFGFLNMSLENAQQYIFRLSPSTGWEFVTPSAKATLAAVMYAVYNSKTFEDAILKGISLGGDTDSVASLVGAIMGFELGLKGIPTEWQNIVHDQNEYDQEYLMNLGQRLFLERK